MSRKHTNRLTRLNLLKLEDRLVPAQILLASGANASYPTIWREVPAGPDPALTISRFITGNFLLTKDANGGSIDFNKDGKNDFVTNGDGVEAIGYGSSNVFESAHRNPFGAAWVSRSDTPEAITPPAQYGGPVIGRMAVADLNADGYQDLLSLSNKGAYHSFIYNPSTNRLDDRKNLIGLNIPGNAVTNGELKLKDFNQDGVPDAVLPIYDSAPQPNGAKFLSAFGVWLGRTGQGGAWQGELEADPYCIVQLNAPNPNLISTGNVSISGDANGLVAANVNAAIADFNQDGLFDLALPEVNGVTFLLNPGNGRFDQAAKVFVATATGLQGVNLVVGDLNNDGLPDLATSNNIVNSSMMLETGTWTAVAGPATVFLNSSSTGGGIQMTASPVIISPLDYNGSLQLADLNLDGNLDMVVGSAAFQNHNFAVAQGDGTGAFGPFKLFQGFTDQADIYSTYKRSLPALAIGDMNGDGLPDIVSEGLYIRSENYGSEGNGTSGVGITGVSYNTTFTIPAATPGNLPNATTGIAYSQTLGHTGGDQSKTYTFSLNPASVALPAGLNLSASGLISGTPGTPGTYQLYVDVIQPNGMRGSSFVNLVVTNAQPNALTISPAILPNVSLNQVVSEQLSAAGGTGTIRYALSSGLLPTGLSLSGTGLIGGTVTATGTFSFTVSATDSNASTGYRQYTVVSTAAPLVPVLQPPTIVAGALSGNRVTVFDASGNPRASFRPFAAAYKGGVNVAQGDVNGDGVPDLIAAVSGGAGPIVRVFNGRDLALISSFVPYVPNFTGGVRVAAGDVDGDGRAEVITGAGPGELSRVKVFSGTTGALQRAFFPFAQQYRGGVTVATGDVDGDGKADIIAGSGTGIRSTVKVFKGTTGALLSTIQPFAAGYTNGVTVGSGDINGDGHADIVVGTVGGTGGVVKVYSGANNALLHTLNPYGTGYTGGINLSVADLTGDGKAEIVTGTTQANIRPVVKAFSGANYAQIDSFFAYSAAVGVSVAAR